MVVRCAGAVRGRNAQTFDEANVEGSHRVMEEARNSGTCERFLHMSSLAARYPELSWYAQSKFDAEQQVISAVGDVKVEIFRPTAVYGPGARELQLLFSWLLRGLLVRLGTTESHLSFVHLFDLTAAVLQWINSPIAKLATYEVNDGTLGGYSWKGLAKIGANVGAARVRQIPVSLGTHADFEQGCELIHCYLTCSNRDITNAIGWVPRITLRRALQDRLF